MKKLLLIIGSLLSIISCKPNSTDETSPPNLIIIFTDDQGYNDVGCYGSPDIKTPHLDRMASEGVKLTNFYAAQPICSASRAALLTGCYSNRVGVHQAYMPANDFGLNPSETTIAEMLKPKDYHTAIFGKWHLGDDPEFMPLRQGFDEFYGIPYSNDMWPLHPAQGKWFNFPPLPLYDGETIVDTLTDQSFLTTALTEKSVDFIKRNKANPFFLYLAHPQPHVPLYVSDKFKGKSERGIYGDVIMEIDWSVGELLKALKENEIDENTLVIFTSDNGPWLSYGEHSGSAYPLREGKQTTWEGGQRVPCIIRYLNKIPQNNVVNTPLMSIDILPTLAQLAEVPLPANKIDGKDIWDVLTLDTQDSPHEAYYFYYNVNELQAVRYKDWKLYYPRKYKTLSGREGGKDGLPVAYDFVTTDENQLFDLSTDLREQHNIASEYPEVVAIIDSLANIKRAELGDSFQNLVGNENRLVGEIE